MNSHPSSESGAADGVDVLVVGAGPTGDALANALGARGLSVCVVERNRGILPIPRAVHIDGETMRIFHGMGLAVPLATESERRRNSNPRKLYPADPGLIRAFDISGRSNLGTAAPLILEQGEYAEAGLSASLESKTWQFSLDAANLTNERGNSFSYGNPFTVFNGNQITPLRPRTVRLGVRMQL